MTVAVLLSLAAVGQQCATNGVRYSTRYAAPAYQAQTYQTQTYYQAPAYYQAPYVETKVVVVEAAPNYTAIAGDYVRSEARGKEADERERKLYEKIASLTGAVTQLREIVVTTGSAPQPQQPYGSPQQPVYGSPQQYPPSLQPPQQPQYAAPPPPAKNPPLPSKGPGPPPLPPLPPDPTGLGAGPAPALPVVMQSCTTCHTAPNAKGGVTLFLADGSPAPIGRDLAGRVADAVADGRMPPRAERPVTLAEFRDITNWLNSVVRPELAAR